MKILHIPIHIQGRIQGGAGGTRKSTVTHHSNTKRDKEEDGKRRISFLEL